MLCLGIPRADQLTTCRYLLHEDPTNVSEAVREVFRLGSDLASHILIRPWNGHSISRMHGFFFTLGEKISVIS